MSYIEMKSRELMLMCEELLCVSLVFSLEEKFLKLGLGCLTPTPIPSHLCLIKDTKGESNRVLLVQMY